MNRQFLELFKKLMNEQKKRKLWKKAVTVLAGFVVFFTVYALVLPAITMESGNTDAVGITLSGNAVSDDFDEKTTASGNTVPITPKVPEEEKSELVEQEKVTEQEKVVEPEKDIEKVPYKYEDDELAVEVTLPEGSSVPEGAVLRVRTIVDTDDEYEDLAKQAEEAVDGQAEEVVLYDISFYTVENKYIPVAEEATVSFQFKETVFAEAEGEVTVLHYEEEGAAPVELAEVEVQTDENDAVEAVTFQTEGFSVFAVVKVLNTTPAVLTELELVKTPSQINLNEKNYVMTNYNGTRMVDYKTHSTAGRLDSPLISSIKPEDYVYWTFTGDETNGYKISTTVGSDTYYMKLSGSDLTVEEEEANASNFHIKTLVNYEDCIALYINNTTYINLHGGANGFSGYNGLDYNSCLCLYTVEDKVQDYNVVTNLNGKSYAIVCTDGNKALSSEMNDSQNRLKAVTVEIIDSSYVVGEDVTEWMFAAVNANKGIYTISAKRDNITYYLNIGDNGKLAISNNEQEFVIREYANGKVSITSGNGALDHYVNEGLFGSWSYTGSSNQQMILCEKQEQAIIVYELGVGNSYIGNSWISDSGWTATGKPNLNSYDDVIQKISSKGENLYTVGGDRNENGHFWNCNFIKTYENGDENQEVYGGASTSYLNAYMEMVDEPYGKEFRFNGWEATDINGVVHLMPENALVVLKDEDTVIVTYNDGENKIQAEFSSGTIFHGKWTQVSDIAMFFLNYKGVVLDTNVNTFTGWLPEHVAWTPCVGIAYVYYGNENVGNNQYPLKVGSDINDLFDPDNTGTKLEFRFVSEYRDGKYWFNKDEKGISPETFEHHAIKYIKDTMEYDASRFTIRLSTSEASNNPAIDMEYADSDHYDIVWYTMKDQTDCWHIDGVLVADTSSMEVVKTISGLDDEDAKEVMEDLNFDIRLGPNRENYFTMNTQSVAGLYDYKGAQSSIKSYNWTLDAVTDELYTITEKGYAVDGYDCSTIIVVRNKDGSYHEIYGSDSTQTVVSDAVDEYANGYLLGGKAESVFFNNFYTKENTGLFNITKRDSSVSDLGDVAGKLAGAEFTLKDENGKIVAVETTNSNGSATFSNLDIGTYTLTESSVPDGFSTPNKTWTVAVSKDDIKNIVVDITDNANNEKKTVYDGGIKEAYLINNSPNTTTITLTKRFEDLSKTELNAMRSGITAYKIILKEQVANGEEYTLILPTEEVVSANVYVGEEASTDGFSFRWRISNVEPGKYTITEHNFRNVSSKDTIVGITDQFVLIDYKNQTASIQDVEIVSNVGNVIAITNKYTNNFKLQLLKQDATDTSKVLTGARFAIYGDFYEGTGESSQRIQYIDSDGKIAYAYYIGLLTEETAGTYVKEGLFLSSDEDYRTYVLKEVNAPDGYAASKDLIVIEDVGPGRKNNVTGTGTIGKYDNGIFKLEVTNQKREDAKVSVTAKTEWIDAVGTPPKVKLQLYHAVEGGDLAMVENSEVELNGTEARSYIWINQPAYDNSGNEYIYYVREVPPDSFRTEYSEGEVSAGTVTVGKTKWDLVSKAYEVTIKNYYMYELPETGGSGTLWYTIGGLALTMTAALMFMTINEKKVRVKK